MKRIIAVCLVLLLLCGCTTVNDGGSSMYSSDIVTEVLENTENKSSEPTEPQIQTPSESTPVTSTVATPMAAYLYKEGVYYGLNDIDQIDKISKEVESWYANCDELPITRYATDEDHIKYDKENQTVIELIYETPILWNGKVAITNDIRRVVISVTGNNTGYVCCADSSGKYYKFMLTGENYKLEPIISELKTVEMKKGHNC